MRPEPIFAERGCCPAGIVEDLYAAADIGGSKFIWIDTLHCQVPTVYTAGVEDQRLGKCAPKII
ncbi:MAG TPA: hypothetical protein DCY42_09560 [Chloroflexi bacterium]|nr:hypothetical protein [Chloroflexota bacterium]